MDKPYRSLTRGALALATLPLAGCGTPTLLTKEGALAAFKPLRNSLQAPCEMQRDVAEHNSRYDSMKTGNPVTYKAPCDVDKKPALSTEPKTS